MPRRKEPRIPDAILDQLLAGADAKTVFDPNGLLDDLKKALYARGMSTREIVAYRTIKGARDARSLKHEQ